MTRIEIDLNVRTRNNETFAGFEDVAGPMSLGMNVEVFESESDVVGQGRVTEIDTAREIVYIAVEWASLREASQVPAHRVGLVDVSDVAEALREQFRLLTGDPRPSLPSSTTCSIVDRFIARPVGRSWSVLPYSEGVHFSECGRVTTESDMKVSG